MQARIIAVIGDKGGIGKSALAYELAAALDYVLVDLDWSGGGVTGTWGYQGHRAHFLIDGGPRVPHVWRRPHRPALVPSVPELSGDEWPLNRADVGDRLRGLEYPIVVDTHPGMNQLTMAAIDVADLLVVPTVLRERELNALDQMLIEGLAVNDLLVVPNMVPPATPRRQLERLQAMLAPYERIPVAPPVSWHPWWPRRQRRAALVLDPNPGQEVARAAEELRRVAREVERCLA